MRKSLVLLALWSCAAIFCAGQKPNITNAKIQETSATAGLKAAVENIAQKQEAPAWIGYRIPTTAKERSMCCFNSWSDSENAGNRCCMGCRLESGSGGSFTGTMSNCSPPEPFHYAFVFFRVEAKQVMKIRNYSADCGLDFGGLPLYWLENVNPAQSVELLSELALAANTATDQKKSSNSAISAIALHDDPSADAALEKMIQPGQPASLREHVPFWLEAERGKKGLEVLRKYVRNDSSERFREKGVFAFTLSKEPEAIQELIAMAHNDPSPRVRRQAVFWMGHLGGQKLAREITDSIENDPETSVKKHAVFALSQMPAGEGVPLLINVAKTNKNPVVRKEAVRWLGMSNDPRALEYLEQILTK